MVLQSDFLGVFLFLSAAPMRATDGILSVSSVAPFASATLSEPGASSRFCVIDSPSLTHMHALSSRVCPA